MWTSTDMTLCALDAAQQFSRDTYHDRRLVYAFTGNERSCTWTFRLYGVDGFFTLTKSMEETIWTCCSIPSFKVAP